MVVQINGEAREIGAGLNVTQLLDEFGIRAGRVVVELNLNVLSRDAHETTVLQDGDKVEIIQFVGGG